MTPKGIGEKTARGILTDGLARRSGKKLSGTTEELVVTAAGRAAVDRAGTE